MKNSILFCFTLILLAIQLNAQEHNNVFNNDLSKIDKTFQSPTAAALGQHTDVPVSLYNGMPNISIPLHTINEGQLSLPLQLNYYGGGTKPDMHPGWVGAEWTLSANAMISRRINGQPDELAVLGYDHNTAQYAFYTIGMNSNWNEPYPSLQRLKQIKAAVQKPGTCDGYDMSAHNFKVFYEDYEPDEFSFNFNGYSGTFYLLGGEGNVVGQPDIYVEMISDPIIMDVQNSYRWRNLRTSIEDRFLPRLSTYYNIRGFRITTPDGIQYEFGQKWGSPTSDLSAIDISRDFQPYPLDLKTFDGWHLVRIVSPEGEELAKYTYDKPYRAASFSKSFSFSNAGMPEDGVHLPIVNPTYPGATVPKIKYEFNSNYYGKELSNSYLKSIETKGHLIHFNKSETTELEYDYADIQDAWDKKEGFGTYFGDIRNLENISNLYDFRWYKLDQVQITDKFTNQSKYFDLTYSNSKTSRLKLLQVKERGKTPYLLEYDASEKIPNYNSYVTDAFGYSKWYMGIPYDLHKAYLPALPYSDADDTLFDDLHKYYEVNKQFGDGLSSLPGTLNKIIYPTRGYSFFHYEPHSTDSGAASNSGIRIKKIEFFDNDGLLEYTKNYLYEGGYATYQDQPKFSFDYYLFNDTADPYYHIKFFYSNFYSPVGSTGSSSMVGYSKVTEQQTGNGKIVHYFRNFIDHIDMGGAEHKDLDWQDIRENAYLELDPQLSLKRKLSSRENERGQLIGKWIYKEGSPYPFTKEKYNYSFSPNNVGSKGELIIESSQSFYVNRTFAHSPRIASMGCFIGYDTMEIKDKLFYYIFLDPISLISKEHAEIDSNGNETLKTTTNYDYNAYNKVLKESTITSKGDKLITEYKYSHEDRDLPYVVGISGIYPELGSKKISSLIETKSKIIKTGSTNYLSGNITQYKDFKDFDNPSETAIDFRPWQLLTTVNTNPTTTSFVDITRDTGNQNISYDSRYIPKVVIDEYNSTGQILQYHKSDDKPLSYYWGYNNLYPIVKAENITYPNLEIAVQNAIPSAFASLHDFLIDIGNLSSLAQRQSWGVFNTNLKNEIENISGSNVFFSTYTYSPINGITSMTDPKGFTLYYEYDDSNRLKQVKDADGNILSENEYHYKN